MKTSIHWVASDVKLVYSLIGSKIRWQVRQGDSTKTSTWGWRSVGYFSWSFFCAAHCGNRMWLLDIQIGANPNRCAMRIICTRCWEDLLWKKRNAKYLNFYINHMLRWQYLQYIKLKYLANCFNFYNMACRKFKTAYVVHVDKTFLEWLSKDERKMGALFLIPALKLLPLFHLITF